jgi:outer membrane protein insertion porin family
MASGSPKEAIRRRNKGLVVLLLCASIAAGQQKKKPPTAPPPDPAPQTVFLLETLKVQGNQRIAPEKIIAVSGLKIGVPVAKSDFNAARDRLLATGAFESVGCAFKPSASNTGYAGVIDVVEVEQIYPYRFEDLPVPADKLRAALREQEPILGDDIPAHKDVLDRYVAVVQRITGPDVKVTAKLTSEAGPGYVILFRPDTPRLHVAEVRFSGNEVITSAALQRAFADVAFGTAYSDATIRAMLDASVRPLYDARGRIRVSFPTIETEPAKEYEGVIVKVAITEGPSYSLGGVQFAGVSPSDAVELKRIANLQPNDVANFDDVNAALEKIYARFRTKGYLRVTGKADRDIDDKEHRVSVTLAIDPGAQFKMGKLEIVGLDILSEPPIRKVWSIQPGAPFEPQYPDAFLKDLREQGVFDNLGKTRAETNIDEKSHVVDVTLHFSGAGPKEEKKIPGRGGRGG